MNTEKRNHLKKLSKGLALVGSTVVLPIKWTTPIVKSVILPAHAQASICEERDITGDWEFLLDIDLAFLNLIFMTLNLDGSGGSSVGNLEWHLEDTKVVITTFDADTNLEIMFKSELRPSCSSFDGRYELRSDTVELSGSFTAKPCVRDICGLIL